MVKVLALGIYHEDRAEHVVCLGFDQTHQRFQRVGERSAARDQLEHMLLAFREREAEFAIGDVVIHPYPRYVRIHGRFDRNGAHRDPAPLAADVPETELALERHSRCERLTPHALHACAVFGMDHLA